MRIGVPREIKDGERRVGMTPYGVGRLVGAGHAVVVEANAGRAVGFSDTDFAAAGARIVSEPAEAWSAEVVAKVKEVQPREYALLAPSSLVLCYAQLNRDAALTDAVLRARVRILAYENVRADDGTLPLLSPMSRIAGRLAPLIAAQLLASADGAGVLMTGVDAVAPARVLVVGAGTVAIEAARIAARIGCEVGVFSRGATRLRALAQALSAAGTPVQTARIDDSPARFADAVAEADVVIGAVRDPGKLSPKLISHDMLARMRAGSVLIDVGIDQGGISQASRQTVLSAPAFVASGVVHYCVPNMPALVARTATFALTAATLPCIERLANLGVERAVADDPGLAAGIMVWDGAVVHAGLASDCRLPLQRPPWVSRPELLRTR
ncbi:MAG TPA: alanine dehydrogenase [Casimicrobiaceae bacterium]|nr:alanine dehydrogenase [Casimicrobiaceae bacterium]